MVASKKKSTSKQPEKLSAEDEEIIKQTLKEELPQKTGIVITGPAGGSLASNVLLHALKDKKQYPYTNDLQIYEEDDPNALIDWANDKNINPLYFATTYEEYLKGDNKLVQRLKELKVKDPSITITIAEPFLGIPESDILDMARGYGLEDEQGEETSNKEEEEGET